MIKPTREAATFRWRAMLAAVLAASVQYTPNVFACSCAPVPPPCQAYGQTPLIFLGTVTEALAYRDGRVVRARMRVDHAYKGVTEKTLVLFDDGWCDGPQLQVGQPYLMYTRRLDNGEIPSRGCTRSRHVKYADEDLKYLSSLSGASPTGTVFGKVVIRTDDYRGYDKPLAAAVVEINGPTGTRTTTTDGEGRYSFENLEPAKYSATAEVEGLRMLSFEYDGKPLSALVEARGCAVVNMVMRRKWRGAIEGRVMRSDGEPASAGIELRLILLQNHEGTEESHSLFLHAVRPNEQGEYSFDEVAPGRYKIVMNEGRFPSEKAPYPTIYWPGSRTKEGALVIEVSDAPGKQRYDFKLPPEPKSTRVAGIVVTPDGMPVKGAQVLISALPDNSSAENDENRPETDADGHFSFTPVDGFEYRLSAFHFSGRALHSAKLPFSLGKGPESIRIVLDRPGRFDDDPMERPRLRRE